MVGSRTHLLQGFLALARSQSYPSGCYLTLDVDLVGPVFVILLSENLANRGKLLQVFSRRFDIADM